MKRFKYLFLLTLLGLMFIAMPVMASGIQVVVDGKVVEFTDQKPYIDKANRTQVPLRAPMEAMGCEVSWNDSLQQAVISKDGTMVEFVIGSNQYTINDVTKTMDTTATITGNRTCIPIRYAAEAFGAEVDWIADKKAVAIYTKKTSAEEKQKIEKEIPEVKKPASEVVKREIKPRWDGDTPFSYDVIMYSDTFSNTFPLFMEDPNPAPLAPVKDTTVLKIEKVKYYKEDFIMLTQTKPANIDIIIGTDINDETKSFDPVAWGSGTVGLYDVNRLNSDDTCSLYYPLKGYTKEQLKEISTADKWTLFWSHCAFVIDNPLK